MGRSSGENFTKYRHEVTTSAVVSRPLSESSGGPLLPPSLYSSIYYPLFLNHHPTPLYPIPTQNTGNALVTPLGPRVYKRPGDHLLFSGSHTRSPLNLL
ncbi:hypothetical protein EVAR_75445_1 [Eumeta japonica]|uniref:Uncharacterized protein n=1 Tax=Eumeta variegata TaxID=151549 RepID=A0A4C1TN41_EUMVA|nr:hypothetical protein EVAR_75445_1 [Eumeta japonica]